MAAWKVRARQAGPRLDKPFAAYEFDVSAQYTCGAI
jgi:hypothetical protein